MSGTVESHLDRWSNRVQKELLALTTDNADLESTENRSMLPTFTTVREHKLDLNTGVCLVVVDVDIRKKTGTIDTIVVKLDASFKSNTSKASYPFSAPIARIADGAQFFPPGSTIKNGDTIAVDLDWTPSLHLTDVIMNIGLKIKESVMQKEPFHPEPSVSTGNSKRGFGGFSFGKASSSISKAFATKPSLPSTPGTTTKETRRATANERKISASAQGTTTTGVRASTGSPRKSTSAKSTTTPGSSSNNAGAESSTVKIGDEINLLEEPWVNAHGVYSCKAIQRPQFIEESMQAAMRRLEQQGQQNQNFTSPSAMLRSFAQTTRGLMEESFLMVTESHIIELKASRLNVSSGTVVFCIRIDMMAKLKFRRQESLSLFFKTAPNEPLVYMCPDSGDAVHQIQSVLKRHGVRGKHTNAAAYKAISEAMHLVQAIQTKELALKHDPTVQRVNEIMDLYRQAAERFEVAGDIRHEEVVTHMRKFLALPSTISILDGSFKKPDDSPKRITRMLEIGVPEGEVLERLDSHLLYNDDDGDGNAPSKLLSKQELENDKAFEQNIDNIIKDARADFEKLNAESCSNTLETDQSSANSSIVDDLADVAADLDAMMKEADRELAELMNS